MRNYDFANKSELVEGDTWTWADPNGSRSFKYVKCSDGLYTIEENGKLWDEKFSKATLVPDIQTIVVDVDDKNKKLILATTPKFESNNVLNIDMNAMFDLLEYMYDYLADENVIKCICNGLFDDVKNKDFYLAVLELGCKKQNLDVKQLNKIKNNIEKALELREQHLNIFPNEKGKNSPLYFVRDILGLSKLDLRCQMKFHNTYLYSSILKNEECYVYTNIKVVKNDKNLTDEDIKNIIHDMLYIKSIDEYGTFKDMVDMTELSSNLEKVAQNLNFDDIKELFKVINFRTSGHGSSSEEADIIDYDNEREFLKFNKNQYEDAKKRIEKFIENAQARNSQPNNE